MIMSETDDLKTWVSDQILSLVGYSTPVIVQFIIGLSKQAKSPADMLSELVAFGLSSGETLAFAEEVYARVPRGNASANVYQKQEQDAAMLVQKQKAYSLLDVDDAPAPAPADESCVGVKSRSADHDYGEDEDDDEKLYVLSAREGKRGKVKDSGGSCDDDGSESEEEKSIDQRERRELERRMREKDAGRTRKLMTESKRGKGKSAERGYDVEELRKRSREVYLRKRVLKKVGELRDELEDEERLFDGVVLTELERRDLKRKREIYGIVSRPSTAEDAGEYKIPDAYDDEGRVNQKKRFAVASYTALQRC